MKKNEKLNEMLNLNFNGCVVCSFLKWKKNLLFDLQYNSNDM